MSCGDRMQSRRDYEEKQLADLLAAYQSAGIVVYGQVEGLPTTYAKILVKSDGTVKVEGITAISGSVDISDKWSRQLGQVDIQRYLGLTIGVSNPLHSQIVVSGAVVDPRSTRALVKTTDELYSVLRTDAGVAYDARQVLGSQTQQLLQRASTYELLATLRQAGAELSTSNPLFTGVVDASGNRLPAMDASTRPGYVDMTDRAERLTGVVYGSQAQQLLQRASTYDLIVQLRNAGVEIDPRSIRSLISGDVVTAYGSQTQALLQRATTYDLLVALRQGGSELSTTNPIFAGIVDSSGNRLPSMDAAARRGYVSITDGTNVMPTMDTSARKGYVNVEQATRASLCNKPEREDKISYGGLFSPNGSVAVQIVAGSTGKVIKVYNAGYHCAANGTHYFYFGTSTTPPTLPASKTFLFCITSGHFRETYSQPDPSATGDGLYFFSSVAETNMSIDVGYVQE